MSVSPYKASKFTFQGLEILKNDTANGTYPTADTGEDTTPYAPIPKTGFWNFYATGIFATGAQASLEWSIDGTNFYPYFVNGNQLFFTDSNRVVSFLQIEVPIKLRSTITNAGSTTNISLTGFSL